LLDTNKKVNVIAQEVGISGSCQIIKYRLSRGNSLLDYAVKNGLARRVTEEENKILA